jgi:hypothetical protein
MISRRDRAFVVAAVVLLALGACASGDAGAPTSPTVATQPQAQVTSVPTATESASAVPEIPAAARRGDAEGAAAFAGHYFRLVSAAYRSGDTARVRAVANADCGNCMQIAGEIDRHLSDGGRYEGGEISVLSAQAQSPDPTGMALVTVVYDQAPLRAINRDGSVLAEGRGAQNQAVRFYAEFKGGKWEVFGYALEDS